MLVGINYSWYASLCCYNKQSSNLNAFTQKCLFLAYNTCALWADVALYDVVTWAPGLMELPSWEVLPWNHGKRKSSRILCIRSYSFHTKMTHVSVVPVHWPNKSHCHDKLQRGWKGAIPSCVQSREEWEYFCTTPMTTTEKQCIYCSVVV